MRSIASDVSFLLDETLSVIECNGTEEIIFTTIDGEKYKMYHEQDCCEQVTLEDVTGNLDDLIGSPITMAEEVTQEGETDFGTETWTFYKLATVKGYVTLRWHGESNGYYSEEVSFVKIVEIHVH